jgi:hypothetical protein
MEPPKAKFITELYPMDEVTHMVSEFQEKGYTILKDVFERKSAKEFKGAEFISIVCTVPASGQQLLNNNDYRHYK